MQTDEIQKNITKSILMHLVILTVSAHPYCHPKVNVFCHAGIGSVMGEAFYFVKKPAPFVRVAYAPGKTKAINPFCATAQIKKDGIFPIM